MSEIESDFETDVVVPLRKAKLFYARCRLLLAAIVPCCLGIWQLTHGTLPQIISGLGAILVGIVLFAFFVYTARLSEKTEPKLTKLSNGLSGIQLFWLGAIIAQLPVVLGIYLSYTMVRFQPEAFYFASFFILFSGIGLMVYGIVQVLREKNERRSTNTEEMPKDVKHE
jgi:hypothetical protein